MPDKCIANAIGLLMGGAERGPRANTRTAPITDGEKPAQEHQISAAIAGENAAEEQQTSAANRGRKPRKRKKRSATADGENSAEGQQISAQGGRPPEETPQPGHSAVGGADLPEAISNFWGELHNGLNVPVPDLSFDMMDFANGCWADFLKRIEKSIVTDCFGESPMT
jgi:hypothetical protein